MEKGKIGGIRIQNSETPEPIATKFGIGDYVGDVTQQAKIQIERPSGRAGKWVKCHSLSRGFYPRDDSDARVSAVVDWVSVTRLYCIKNG